MSTLTPVKLDLDDDGTLWLWLDDGDNFDARRLGPLRSVEDDVPESLLPEYFALVELSRDALTSDDMRAEASSAFYRGQGVLR